MKRPAGFAPDPGNERLLRRSEGTRSSCWTVAAGEPTAIRGVRLLARGEMSVRHLDPARSKLGAALARGLSGPIPGVGERWLYLGAAAGTTAAHVADLVGPRGSVFAVEKSVRPFARLLEVAEAYPNLLPILADARQPLDLGPLVPMVDGIYADIAQPDQLEIVRSNAAEFLRPGGALLFALKTASMGRDRTPEEHAREGRRILGADFELAPPVPLDPFHRRHYMLGGRAHGAAPAGSRGRSRGRVRLVRGRR